MPRYAAIDVGTNTVRLLVAEAEAGSLAPVERRLEITRLGEGVDASRALRPGAMARTAQAVEAFVRRAAELGARVLRAAGTSALRDARNRDAFLRLLQERAGVELEVLQGPEEGRLAYLGATRGLGEGPFVVCDIGGGSTELIRGREAAETVWSADVGSVRVRERCLRSDPPTPQEIEEARAVVGAAVERARRETGIGGDETLVGVAGTITTLAALCLGLQRYEPGCVHGTVVGADQVAVWAARLLRMPVAEVRRLPSMQPGRADVIAAGCLILDEVMRGLGFSQVLVSEADILDGLLLDALR